MLIRLFAALVAIAALGASPASAFFGKNTEKVRILYGPTDNPVHELMSKSLKEHRVLETLQELLSGFRLPKTLTLQVAGCKGVVNAWYEDDTVTVCYEFVGDVIMRAPQQTTPEGITREDAIAGFIAEVFLHETGHALFDLLDVPIFGREEDAADQFAAYILLQLEQAEARKMIGGIAHMLWNESKIRKVDRDAFANIHGLPAQRFFNLVCMAYGSDTKYFADLVDKGFLPKERAEGCEAEYGQIKHAMDTLISPHIEPASRAKFQTTLKRFRAPSRIRTAPP
jgi:hypothetical protein